MLFFLGCLIRYKWDNNEKQFKPETGLVQLRAGLGVFANLRPATVLPQVVDPESTPESKLISGDLLPLGTQSSTEISPSSEGSTLSDLTCSFDKAASITEKLRNEAPVCETSGTEAYVVADHLKQAGIQVMRSKDVDDGMKKLVDALIDVLLKEVYAVPDGKEKGKYRVESLYSIRVCITFVSLMLWIVVLAVAVLMMLGADDLDPWRMPPT